MLLHDQIAALAVGGTAAAPVAAQSAAAVTAACLGAYYVIVLPSSCHGLNCSANNSSTLSDCPKMTERKASGLCFDCCEPMLTETCWLAAGSASLCTALYFHYGRKDAVLFDVSSSRIAQAVASVLVPNSCVFVTRVGSALPQRPLYQVCQ